MVKNKYQCHNLCDTCRTSAVSLSGIYELSGFSLIRTALGAQVQDRMWNFPVRCRQRSYRYVKQKRNIMEGEDIFAEDFVISHKNFPVRHFSIIVWRTIIKIYLRNAKNSIFPQLKSAEDTVSVKSFIQMDVRVKVQTGEEYSERPV